MMLTRLTLIGAPSPLLRLFEIPRTLERYPHFEAQLNTPFDQCELFCHVEGY